MDNEGRFNNIIKSISQFSFLDILKFICWSAAWGFTKYRDCIIELITGCT